MTLNAGRHARRQATQHGCLPSLLGDGVKGFEIVYREEKIFCTGPTCAAKAEQKSLLPARKANQKKDPFHLYSLSPHSPKFQESAGAITLYSLCLRAILTRVV
jgi:hypothetical protein